MLFSLFNNRKENCKRGVPARRQNRAICQSQLKSQMTQTHAAEIEKVELVAVKFVMVLGREGRAQWNAPHDVPSTGHARERAVGGRGHSQIGALVLVVESANGELL